MFNSTNRTRGRCVMTLSAVALFSLFHISSSAANDDCNSGRAGADCNQTDSFNSSANVYFDGAAATDGLAIATDLLNLGMQAAGIAANMQSMQGSGSVRHTYGQGAPQVNRSSGNRSTITGLGR